MAKQIMAEVVNPNWDNILRWLRSIYKGGSKKQAIKVLTGTWPDTMDKERAIEILEGRLELTIKEPSA